MPMENNYYLKRQVSIAKIRQKLLDLNQSLALAIFQRNLYLRISLLGDCNLNCAICHNEGAPRKGFQELSFCIKFMKAAFNVGFRRVQFTGGEPLLHPLIGKFIKGAKNIFRDVGITTNGILLYEKIRDLLKAGINRIHISLHVQTLIHRSGKKFGIPLWLYDIIKIVNNEDIIIRLNLPIIFDKIDYYQELLEELSFLKCDIKPFTIIPYGNEENNYTTLQKLYDLVNRENIRRKLIGLPVRLELRDYNRPSGIRCIRCDGLRNCLEQSRSLRLGADKILRPCLASRKWDIAVNGDNIDMQIEEAALLAIDYKW